MGHQISVFMTNSSTAVKSVKDLPFASTIKTGSVEDQLSASIEKERPNAGSAAYKTSVSMTG